MSVATLGHNSGVDDLTLLREEIRQRMNVGNMSHNWRAMWEIFLSEMPPADKLVALAVGFFANRETARCHPSVNWLEAMTGYKRSRILAATTKAATDGHLQKIESGRGRGRATVYQLSVPERTLRELSEKLHGHGHNPENVHEDGHFKMSATVDSCEKMSTDLAKMSTKPAENVHERGPQLIIEPIEPDLESRAQKISNPPSWKMSAALNPAERNAQHDVGWTENGALTVMNGFAAVLAQNFPRVDLQSGLGIVAGDIGEARSRLSATQVKDRITRRFGYLENEERGKDRRYAQRGAAPPGPPQPRASSSAEPDWVIKKREDAKAWREAEERVFGGSK